MSRSQFLRIISYDISCNKRRRRIATILEDRATRVQYSVFETRMSERALERLVEDLNEHLDEFDSLRVYTVGRSGERHCAVYGAGVPIETETGYWLL
ncbi:CRISPR-associated endonuclease Cas2 [Terasakiella pusilla]|uniref:CRISPR-associated endonuclease Cas2 n=1 Tax=Terasakiella pusilla TaxID=64973 RepID=UPI003AA7E915